MEAGTPHRLNALALFSKDWKTPGFLRRTRDMHLGWFYHDTPYAQPPYDRSKVVQHWSSPERPAEVALEVGTGSASDSELMMYCMASRMPLMPTASS